MPGDYLAYVVGVAGIQMFEMMRSEFLANPATAEVALLTRRVVTGALSLVGQVVPGWVIGRAALILAGAGWTARFVPKHRMGAR
ncbi:MAG: hypothetical protein NXI28_25155, partial [bacterium]|nr:hypothetical protein [bacterium]